MLSRAHKTVRNRQLRAAVRSRGVAGDLSHVGGFSDVTRLDCEQMMVAVQLSSDSNIRLCKSSSQVTELIVTYTKSLAELPFKWVWW